MQKIFAKLSAKLAALLTISILSACAVADPDKEEQVDLGNFAFGHNVAVTKNAKKVGPSRTASADEWEIAMEGAMEKRFGRYEGDKFYHIGINLDAYALAVPGIPLVLSPKSIMAITVNVWDDAENEKLTLEPRRMTVFEQIDGDTIVGSGLTQTREEQMSNLTANMAKAVERFLVANADWFGVEASDAAKAAAEQDVLKIPDQDGASSTVAGTSNESALTDAAASVETVSSEGEASVN
ncbi:MAG: hypothetical protein ABJ327_14480 [Litoreibacter sp.]